MYIVHYEQNYNHVTQDIIKNILKTSWNSFKDHKSGLKLFQKYKCLLEVYVRLLTVCYDYERNDS